VVIRVKDIEIVEGLRKQDMLALHTVIDQYGDLIYKVVHSVLDTAQSKVLVDECVDDILLIVWYNINSYDKIVGSLEIGLYLLRNLKPLIINEKVIRSINYKSFSKTYM
jgi:hypothetical protein